MRREGRTFARCGTNIDGLHKNKDCVGGSVAAVLVVFVSGLIVVKTGFDLVLCV